MPLGRVLKRAARLHRPRRKLARQVLAVHLKKPNTQSQKGHVAAASLSLGKPTLNHPQDRAAASLRCCGPIELQHCNCGSELERHRTRADTCICGMREPIKLDNDKLGAP